MTLALALCLSPISFGEPLWRDFSAAYVGGSGFTLDPDQQQTVNL
jgi:hypothetical protein